MTQIIKWAGTAFAFGIALYIGIYYYAAHSEAYKFSETWLRESEPLKSNVGEISSLRLSPWGGYSERFAGSDRHVWLIVQVTGSKQTVKVKLALKNDGTGWTVTQSGFLK